MTIRIRLWFVRYKIKDFIRRQCRRFLRRVGTKTNWQPSDIVGAENGYWFDASDKSTIFCDKSGNMLAWINKMPNGKVQLFQEGQTGIYINPKYIGEMKSYDHALSSQEIDNECHELENKWGIKHKDD